MKVAKIKTNKAKTEKTNETQSYSITSMIKILIILLVIFGAFYGLTAILIKDKQLEEQSDTAVLDSSKITINQLLNRKEREYYVIATKSSQHETSYVETKNIEIYKKYINEYKKDAESLQFYYIDLDSALNKKYFGEELNITNEISELKLSDEVLFKIRDGKIDKTYVGKKDIVDKLSRL